ncbi:hypothetical protein QFC21_002599 [Naganishia friedmannii]|uniref:Uncharacterized protein n=1 Tax=Naganishia friedmannii TaxID=89922 RepID=A0ACC2VV03_9TREE|nr:hypothetical protein QFC21_002599 [Naganishia friedmannii]
MSDEEDDRSRQPGTATSIARLERDQGYDDTDEEEQPINTGMSRDARREQEEDELYSDLALTRLLINRNRRKRQTKGKSRVTYWIFDRRSNPLRTANQRHKRSRANRYLDVEAEVDDEDEDEDEEDDFAGAENGFIEQDVSFNDRPQDVRSHRRLDRRDAEDMSRDAREIARELRERYRRDNKTYDGSANFSDRKANMPGPGNPKLWQVRCKSGTERNVVNTILMKGFVKAEEGDPLLIYSAFQRDSLPGLVFVEADKAQHVDAALKGISNVYLQTPRNNQAKNNPIQLVESRDMVSLLTMKKKVTTVKKGMWVRVKRGKYAGDLAQVNDVQPDGLTAAVLLVPRIDYEPDNRSAEDRKRKKGAGAASLANRAPQRLFSHEAVQERYGRGAAFKKSGRWIFKDEEYTADGLLDKEYPITSLQTEDVHPTLTEIARFGGDDLSAIADKNSTTSISINLDALAEQSRRTAGSNVQPGDRVEATEGELAGMRGIVEAVSGEVVTIRATDSDVGSVELAGKSVKKIFNVGDHVKVTHGRNQDDTGMVLRINANTVTYLSDLTQMERQAFAHDLREAAAVGTTGGRIGEYEMHDLVMVDALTAGVIFQTERDALKILDQNESVRNLRPTQISSKVGPEAKKAIGLDKDDHEFKVGDQMREYMGEGRRGQVLHIHRGLYVFLYSKDMSENGGIFVTRSKNLEPLDTRPTAGPDLSKLDPSVNQNLPQYVSKQGGNYRHLINTKVVIIKGTNKGIRGMIKDTTGDKARVELETNNKVVPLPFGWLKKRDPQTGALTPLPTYGVGQAVMATERMDPSINPYANAGPMMPTPGTMGGPTPASGVPFGMTPNPYAMAGGGRTPAPGLAYGMTPNPYAQMGGGKTPATMGWGTTPNPYAAAGGRTPFVGAGLGAPTPNPYAAVTQNWNQNAGYGGNNNAPAPPVANAQAWGPPGGAAGGTVWNAPPPPPAHTNPYASGNNTNEGW